MKVKLILGCLLAVMLLCCASPAVAQVRIVGAVSGTVFDSTGAVVPNAKVILKDEGTETTKEATSNASGGFLFPSVSFGNYQVTVSVEGFETFVLEHIRVEASRTTDVPVRLKVGSQSQSVTVEAAAVALETTSQLIATTQTTKIVNELPLGGRQAMSLAELVPGFVNRRINNLVGGAMNTTVDGINNASNGWKSGGTVWYNTVPVRLGALEEVTVESGGLGADAGAESGVNVKFITKRGTSLYHGSLVYQPTSEQFNANSWSRNASGLGYRSKGRTHSMGGNIGGRLVPFGYLKDKLFFFANWEHQWNPSMGSVTSSVLTPEAQQGLYRYVLNNNPGQTASVNVLQIATAQGARAKIDPVVQRYMDMSNGIPKYAQQVPTSDLNNTSWVWTHDTSNNHYYPATRVDFYVTQKHQLSFTWNYDHGWTPGVTRFPTPESRLTDPFRSGYFIWSASLLSTLSPTMVNEFRYGTQHSGDSNKSATPKYGTYNAYNGVPLRITGNNNNLPFGTPVEYIDQSNVTGRHFITTIYDTLTKQVGKHSVVVGANFRRTDWKDTTEYFPLPTYSTGAPSGDPLAGTLFTTATVPGINPTSLPSGPAGLYNQLVGRVSSTSYSTTVDPAKKQYGSFIGYNWTRSYMGGAYIQDRWRVTPQLTLNYGLRWEVQGDMFDVMGISAIPTLQDVYGPSVGLFRPGVLSGNNDPTLSIDNQAFKPDYKNFAPNLGLAWNPRKEGFLGRFLDGKTVIRGSWGVTIYDEGTRMFDANVGSNTGKYASQTLQGGTTPALAQFTTLSDVVANPVQLSAFSLPAYQPVVHQKDQTFSRTFSAMDYNLRAPYVIQWNFGIQRELGKDSLLDVKYVGNQSHLQWRTYSLNEVDILSNGFLKEFTNAQSNLAINRNNGKGATFVNNNLPGQVALPIFDAAFGPRGTATAMSNSTAFGSTTFVNYLDYGAAGSMASTLATTANYVCRMFGNSFSPCLRAGVASTGQSYDALGSGYPINFFLLNPFSAGSLNFVGNDGWASYNSLQVQLRHRFSRGLNWTTNYTFAKSLSNTSADSDTMNSPFRTLRDKSMDRRPSNFDSRHVFQTFGSYDLPIGKGHRLNLTTGKGLVDRLFDTLLGGWTASSVVRFNTGLPVQLGGNWNTVNGNTSGVILAPGVTLKQINDMFHGQTLQKVNQTWNSDPRLNRAAATDTTRIGVPLDLIGPDGRANPKFMVPNTTPGQWGQILYIIGKNSFSWDASMTKTFRITERMAFDLYGSASNVLNHPSWGMPSTSLYSTSFGTVGGPSGNRSMTFRGTLRF